MARVERRSSSPRSVTVRRLNIPADRPANLKVPDMINKFICRNVGTELVRINFNEDDSSNYYTLRPGEELPAVIDLADKVIINVISRNDGSILECLFWS